MNESVTEATAPSDGSSVAPLMAKIPPEAAGRRFDQVLAELFPSYSRSRLAAWIRSGDARLDGAAARPRDAVRSGQQVSLRLRIEQATDAAAEDIALAVLYQDDDLLVIDKPAGLVVHPGAGNPAGTLVNALLHHAPELAQLPRAGIVHRLDKDTSGALIVARSVRAHAALVEQLAAREIHRQYEAVVVGMLVAGGSVDAPLDRHPIDRLKRAVVEGGKPALTHYRVRERFRAHSHLECRLETGRTHQIRVHMAHLRHPIVGDPLYGGPLRLPRGATPALTAVLRGFKRQALHAERIGFSHPLSGGKIEVQAPRPLDLEALLRHLREDASA